ncbi:MULTISPECIES: ATP-binding protein [unclassified Streptomyces]|uniref:ATP-binding protein n=1 Tax=unclassified Streptomyces TaxID=2593676 RepID=UPI0037F3EC53
MQPPYRVLGPSQVLRADDGTEAPLKGARLRALLAALAATGGRAVGVRALGAQIWADDDPGASSGQDRTAALQALVGRLRRALGRDAVLSGPGGYRLAAEPDDIDLYRFERLASEGAGALAAGCPERAAVLLDEALGLWRGPALADLPGRDTDPLVVRVEQRHRQARRDRLAAEVALGRSAGALAPLAALAAGQPLDEPLQALRMRALRAAGRPAQALAAYERVRADLAERLGTDPGPELRALYTELLAAGAPGPDASPPPAPGAPPRQSLPAPLTSFIGRDEERAELAAAWDGTRLVTLTGPGGVGKTRLALEAAGTYAGPAHLAELASVREESGVAAAVLTALGGHETLLRHGPPVPGTARKGPYAELVERCAGRRMLLVLDNCEHVVGAVAPLVHTLLAHCPGVTVLATSREPLGVPGEVVRPLGPLPPDAALRLLGERGTAARPGFSVEEDRVAAEEVCRRLDGLPLALELAAARLRVLSLGQIAERLDDRFRLLTSGARTALPRQRTLRAVVDWSWDLLDAPERAVLRRLAVFTGGADLTAAEAVCGGVGTVPAAETGSGTGVSLAPDTVGGVSAAPGARGTGGVPTGFEVPGASSEAPEASDGRAAHGVPETSGPPAGHESPELPGVPVASGVRKALDATDTPRVPELSGVSALEGPAAGIPEGDGPGASGVLDVLAALVDKSLVVAGPARDGGGTRYSLLETIAEYARERLAGSGERAAVERGHLTHYRELARRAEPALRGPEQLAAIELLEREHGNLRGALRTAVALGDEQEALCLVHSLSWFWQLRNHRTDARTWAAEAARLGPDPFAEPVRPAGPLHGRCVDVPPPWSGERLREARRGGHLYALATQSDGATTALERPGARDRLAALVTAYRPGLPQTCRQPGTMWYSARLMTGEFAGLDETLAAVVRDCRDHAPGWDLAFALLTRARLGGHGPDAAEALALFEAAGDSWGVAESLAARGEAHERDGRTAEAAADFARAADAAARVGARSQVPVFTARLAAVRLRLRPDGDPAAERLLAEAAEAAGEWGAEAAGSARLLLAQHYGSTGRTALARTQLTYLEREFGEVTPALFWGLVGGTWAWLDCTDGAYDRALERLARAVRDVETLAHQVAPRLVVAPCATAAWALAGRGGPGDAETGARLLGAYDAHADSGRDGGFRPFTPDTEALIRARAEEHLRGALTPEAYGRGREAGAALTLRAAARLVRGAGGGSRSEERSP